MAHAFGITISCLCALFTVSFAITAEILESSTVLHVGSSQILHCVVDLTGTHLTAANVTWIKGFNTEVDNHLHTVLNDTVARLHITNATFEDKGYYYCAFPEDQYHEFLSTSATVHVGLPPEPVQNLNCYSTNIDDYWCEWEDGRPTNLKTVDTMYYEGPFVENQPILPCHPEGENDFCKVSQGSQTDIFVVSSNPLGNATAHLGREFDPHSEVRPNTPENVRAQITERRKIAMSWEKPADWGSDSHGLNFWLQYHKEGQEWQNVSSKSIGADTRYVLSALDPYTTYFVRVSCAYDVLVYHYPGNPFGTWSEPIEVVTMAEEPVAIINMEPVVPVALHQDDPDYGYKRAVLLSWEPVPELEYRGPNFGYNVSVHDENDQVITYMLTTNDLAHINDLDRFERLTIYVTPYNDVGLGVNRGQTTLRDETTPPGKPENVRVVSKQSDSLQVAWDPPNEITGHVDSFQVEWFQAGDHSGMVSARVVPTDFSHEITGLEAYTMYHVSVKTVNKLGSSSGASFFVTTAQAGPSGSPRSLRVSPLPTNPDQLLVSWQEVLGDEQNGDILYYTIFYCPVDPAQGQDPPITVSLATDSHCPDGTQKMLNVTGDPLPLRQILRDLMPFTEYVVRIAASTSAGQGPISSREQARTSQGQPSKPRNLLSTFSNDSAIHLVWEAPEQMNGVLRNYVIEYNDKTQSSSVESVMLEVNGFINYTIQVRACSEAELILPCGQAAVTHVMTDIGAPLMVNDVDVNLETQDTVILTWGRPSFPNGPIDYYMVRYRPADSELEWQETQPILMTSAKVQVDCDLVDGATFFNFEVFAVNEVDGIPIAGAMSLAHPFEVCNLHKVPVVTIVLAILLPSFMVIVAFCFLIWVKQSDLFKPAPDPYFIEAVLDHNDDKFQMQGRLLSMRTEGEKFDTLRQASSTTNLLHTPYDRLSSKESTSTNSSTDQGIHDMDGFIDELRYVRENTGSRSNSESDEDKASAPAKHMMPIMSDDYEEEDTVFGADCDGSVTYSRIAEVDGPDCSTPMLAKESAQYVSDGSEGYSQLSQVPLQASATPPAPVRGLSDQRSEASFGSQSTVSYHRLGMSGLTPITSVETLPSEDPLAYARLSQGSETDIEYSQLAAASSNQSLTKATAGRAPEQREEQAENNTQESKGVAMSLPSVSAAGRIQPPQEFIVATALSPGNHPHPVSKPDISGYVTSPPASKPAPPMKHVSPDMTKKDLKGSRRNLADSKSQSGSDSSLTDGEGYSTLGLADSPSSSAPHHQLQKVDAHHTKPSVSTPDSHMPVDNGYVPKDMVVSQAPVVPQQSAPANNPSGYVTESDLQALPQKAPCLVDPKSESRNGLPASISSPNKHIPNGLPDVRENGYVSKHDTPPQKTAGQPMTNHNAANPYITPEHMAQIPQGSQIPPLTPTPPHSPPLNNNHPLPPGKEYRPDDPYVGIGTDRNIAALPANHSSDFAVC